MDASGTITGIRVTNPGIGYTSAPTVNFRGGGAAVGRDVGRGVGVGVGAVSRGRVRIGASGSTGPWMSVGVGVGVGRRNPPGGADCAASGAPASASAIRLVRASLVMAPGGAPFKRRGR